MTLLVDLISFAIRVAQRHQPGKERLRAGRFAGVYEQHRLLFNGQQNGKSLLYGERKGVRSFVIGPVSERTDPQGEDSLVDLVRRMISRFVWKFAPWILLG